MKKSLEERVFDFINACHAKYGLKYDLSLVERDYQNNKSYITIICRKHGEFKRRATDFLNGRTCPECK